MAIISDELREVKTLFAVPRRTEITDWAGDLDDEDLIEREDMVVTVSHAGYVKRVPLATYRAQRRGGKGRSGMATRDEDFVTRLFVANTHTPMLFFSSIGKAYKLKVYRLPLGTPQAVVDRLNKELKVVLADPALRHAVAGCLDAMPGSTLLFAPHENSYDRLVPDSHAPTGIGWAYENRTSAIRIPSSGPKARRIEHRVAGGDVNPYLMMAAILGAALNGIEDRLEAPPPFEGNAYDQNLAQLPGSWGEAIDAFATCPEMKRIFSQHLIDNFVMTKRQELHYMAELSDEVFCPAGQHEQWFVEAHQFRIDTTDGIGRPTPEGAHRDGVDLVAVFLVGREGVKGGETRVFEANGPAGQRFTLTEPWSLLLLDDARMIHESTPIQPLQDGGVRDTLVVTCRRGNFQGADVVGQAPSGV